MDSTRVALHIDTYVQRGLSVLAIVRDEAASGAGATIQPHVGALEGDLNFVPIDGTDQPPGSFELLRKDRPQDASRGAHKTTDKHR